MNPILQALGSGYSVKKILTYLSKSSPQLAEKITQAVAYGYPAAEVLKYVMKGGKNVSKQLPNATDEDSNIYTKMQYSLPENMKEAGNFALNAAKVAGGAAVASKVLSGIQGASELVDSAPSPAPVSPQPNLGADALTQSASPLQPGPGLSQQVQQQAQSPVTNAKMPSSPTQVSQASQAMPLSPESPQQSIFDQLTSGVDKSSLEPEKLQQLQFLGMISDKLQEEGKSLNDPEFQKLSKKIQDIVKGNPGTVLRESARFEASKEKKPPTIDQVKELSDLWKLSKEKDPNFPHSLSKVLQRNLGLDEKTADGLSKAFHPSASSENNNEMVKGSSVITPSGDIATIEDLPGKTAKVNVDGKQQVHQTDELTPVPDNAEEIGQLYQQLIDKIPEGHKSRVYDAIGYDPNRNAIKYTYHDGKSYIIDDVPEEIVKEIANSNYLAKTSGGNYMGLYYKGNPSIGAGMHQLISDLQKLRGGKGKEYSYKFEELYSQHRLPKNILKEKFERDKAREREEKKAKKKRSTT